MEKGKKESRKKAETRMIVRLKGNYELLMENFKFYLMKISCRRRFLLFIISFPFLLLSNNSSAQNYSYPVPSQIPVVNKFDFYSCEFCLYEKLYPVGWSK